MSKKNKPLSAKKVRQLDGEAAIEGSNRATHTGRMRGQYHYNSKLVSFLTGLTEEQLFDYICDKGAAWTRGMADAGKIYYNTDVWDNDIVVQWWFLKWRLRDDHHILACLFLLHGEEDRRDCYVKMHAAALSAGTPEYALMLQGLRSVLEIKTDSV